MYKNKAFDGLSPAFGTLTAAMTEIKFSCDVRNSDRQESPYTQWLLYARTFGKNLFYR